MIWKKWQYLLPSRRRAEEREMQEELESLKELAEAGELGSLTLAAENARETWRFTAFDGLAADLRYALRTLRRQPGFLAVAVLSLALGTGANTAIFSFADALLLRPLPVVRPAEVLSISNSTAENPMEGLSFPDYRDIRERSRSFSGVIAYRSMNLGVAAGTAATPQVRLSMLVSDNFFAALGTNPALGRTFLPEEGKIPGRDPVAVLGYDFWNAQYGADRSVVGRTLRINGVDFTIAGVAPESFPGMELLFRPALYVPLSMSGILEGAATLEDRARRVLTVNGRLSGAATLESARAELAAIGQDLERSFPNTNRDRHIAVRTELGARIQQAPVRFVLVTTLMVLVGLVLAIACANVANLMLARARARGREIAIRLAIGAGRVRLARQLMVESLVLALLGGAAGLGVASAAMRFFETLQVSNDIPIALGLALDGRALAFSLLAAVASSVLFGLPPAIQAARTELVPALKSGGKAARARRRMLGRNSLVVGQVALSMVLLVVAGLFVDGLRTILSRSPGFRTDHLISLGLDPSVLRYSPERAYDFHREVLHRIQALPGVASVAMAESMPFSPAQSTVAVIPEGYQLPKGRENVAVFGGAYDENYFDTMKVGIVRGRAFTRDDRAASRPVAIVNEAFAGAYWPSQDPIGKRLRLDRADGAPVEVVGVAKTGQYLFPAEGPRPYVYLPYEQNRRSRMTLIVESRGDPAALSGLLREAVRAVDAGQPVLNLRTVASYESQGVRNWMVFLQIFAAMAAIGLILAMVGLYGLVSYTVGRRTAEIGIRMAIGASRTGVLRLVLREGLVLAGAGIAIGLVLAALIAPAISKGMAGSASRNLAAFLAIPAGLLLASLSACYVPARRAANLDPIRALRQE